MGWHIKEVRNTVEIHGGIAEELMRCGADICDTWESCVDSTECMINDLEGVVFTRENDGKIKLYFDYDHMEHMDYLWQPEIQKVLKKHKVKGDICFSSDDGDNAGTSWGYRFDGKGGMVEISGGRTWKEAKPKKKKRAFNKKLPDFEPVRQIIDNDGFDYAFRYYSDYKEIKDKKFHELRKAYVEAADALEEHIKLRVT